MPRDSGVVGSDLGMTTSPERPTYPAKETCDRCAQDGHDPRARWRPTLKPLNERKGEHDDHQKDTQKQEHSGSLKPKRLVVSGAPDISQCPHRSGPRATCLIRARTPAASGEVSSGR